SWSMVVATTRPAWRIRPISSGDLKMIMVSRTLSQVRQCGQDALGDLCLGPLGVDLPEQSPVRIELEERRGALPIDLQATTDRRLVLVGPLQEWPAARVAPALRPGRVEEHVVGTLAVGTGPAASDALHSGLLVHEEGQRSRQWRVPGPKLCLQRLRLPDVAREAVQDEPAGGLIDGLHHHSDGHLVGNQLAGVEE